MKQRIAINKAVRTRQTRATGTPWAVEDSSTNETRAVCGVINRSSMHAVHALAKQCGQARDWDMAGFLNDCDVLLMLHATFSEHMFKIICEYLLESLETSQTATCNDSVNSSESIDVLQQWIEGEHT